MARSFFSGERKVRNGQGPAGIVKLRRFFEI